MKKIIYAVKLFFEASDLDIGHIPSLWMLPETSAQEKGL